MQQIDPDPTRKNNTRTVDLQIHTKQAQTHVKNKENHPQAFVEITGYVSQGGNSLALVPSV